MGNELQSEESDLVEETVEEVVETEVTQAEEVPENESVEDSAREALKELQAQKEQSDGDEDAETPEPSQEAPSKATKGKKTYDEGLDGEIEPPTRLSASEKNLFNKLPQSFKPAVARMFKEKEAHFTRTQQELQRHTQEARHVIEAVRPYYTSHPELAQSGVTESTLVSALIGAHQKLTNPKTDRQEIERIAKSRGYNVKFVNEDGEEIVGGTPALESHPQFTALQENQKRLEAIIERQALDSRVAPLVAEIESAQQQKDASGRFVYPELSNPGFMSYVKPLVSERRGNNPGLSLGEALKQEVWEYRKQLGYSAAPGQTRLPVENTINSRAVSAAVSARGRVAPQVGSANTNGSVPVNETPEQSARIALEELRRGIN